MRRWVRWRSWTTSVDFISIKTGLSFGRSIIRSISNPRASIPQRNRGSGVVLLEDEETVHNAFFDPTYKD